MGGRKRKIVNMEMKKNLCQPSFAQTLMETKKKKLSAVVVPCIIFHRLRAARQVRRARHGNKSINRQ